MVNGHLLHSLYRDGLKGGPQVTWIRGEKLRSSACSGLENVIFSPHIHRTWEAYFCRSLYNHDWQVRDLVAERRKWATNRLWENSVIGLNNRARDSSLFMLFNLSLFRRKKILRQTMIQADFFTRQNLSVCDGLISGGITISDFELTNYTWLRASRRISKAGFDAGESEHFHSFWASLSSLCHFGEEVS